jgi:hypothetical protein
VGRGSDGLESVDVVRKPQKPVPEEVAERWAEEEWAKEGGGRWTGRGYAA